MGKSKFKKGLSPSDSPFFASARPKMWIGQIEHEGRCPEGCSLFEAKKYFDCKIRHITIFTSVYTLFFICAFTKWRTYGVYALRGVRICCRLFRQRFPYAIRSIGRDFLCGDFFNEPVISNSQRNTGANPSERISKTCPRKADILR